MTPGTPQPDLIVFLLVLNKNLAFFNFLELSSCHLFPFLFISPYVMISLCPIGLYTPAFSFSLVYLHGMCLFCEMNLDNVC